MVFHLRRAFSSLLLISFIVIAESQALNRKTTASVSGKNRTEESTRFNSSIPLLEAWSSAPFSSSPTTSDEIKECDCGENSYNCTINSDGKKDCRCEDGFRPFFNESADDNECRKCDCGEAAISCFYKYDGKQSCRCKEGFKPFFNEFTDDNECKRCDCGNGSYYCRFYNSLKECSCHDRYAVVRNPLSKEDEFCKECYCGEDTYSCEFNAEGGRYCTCGGDSVGEYHPKSGERLCKRCDCGPFSLSCKVNRGEQECKCVEGSYPRYNSSIQTAKCSEPVISDVKSTLPSGWEVATYVLAATLVVFLIVQLIIIKRKQKRQISQNEEVMRPI